MCLTSAWAARRRSGGRRVSSATPIVRDRNARAGACTMRCELAQVSSERRRWPLENYLQMSQVSRAANEFTGPAQGLTGPRNGVASAYGTNQCTQATEGLDRGSNDSTVAVEPLGAESASPREQHEPGSARTRGIARGVLRGPEQASQRRAGGMDRPRRARAATGGDHMIVVGVVTDCHGGEADAPIVRQRGFHRRAP